MDTSIESFFYLANKYSTSFHQCDILVEGKIDMFHIGDIVEGKITGIQPYGAFVLLDNNTSGLIHISEISDGYVKDISHFVHVGDIVKVKVIDFDQNNNQARLSLKALHKRGQNLHVNLCKGRHLYRR